MRSGTLSDVTEPDIPNLHIARMGGFYKHIDNHAVNSDLDFHLLSDFLFTFTHLYQIQQDNKDDRKSKTDSVKNATLHES